MSVLLSATVNPMTILYSVLVLFVLALILGIALAVCGKKFAVKEDERISQIREHLSGANCGACGYAGCDAFAKALVEDGADINSCSATSVEHKQQIAEILGTTVSAEETMVVVACRGGKDALDKYEYMGYGNCRSMELLGGGRKVCKWGCLGMGSCADNCPEHAVAVGDGGYAYVDQSKCIACGKCIASCPKKLIKRIPKNAKIYVACSNCLKGVKDTKAICSSACIACGLCSRVCPNHAIEMVNNLPVIDYAKCDGCGLCKDKCPTKCIVGTEELKEK